MKEMNLFGESKDRAPYTGSEDSGFGMSDDEMTRRMQGLVQLSIAKLKLLGLPVCRYEYETGRAYYELPGGGREYVT